MNFQERLKTLRREAHMSQAALAAACGITVRTVQNYELGARNPQHMVIVQKLAHALGTTPEYLLKGADAYILDARERGGASAARDVEELVKEVTGLFAGGELDEASLDGAMKALTEAYWIAKENNRKYAGKRNTDAAVSEPAEE